MFHSEHGLCFRTSSSVSLCMVCTPAFISISCDGYVALVARYVFFFTCHQVCMTACWTRAGCRKKKRKTSCRGARSHIIKLRVPSQLHRITHACCTEAPKKKRKHGRFFLQDAPEKFCFCSNLTCADRQYLFSGVLLP